MFKFFWIRILFYLIPFCLVTYGDHHVPFNISQDPIIQAKIESIFFFIGIISTLVIFPIIIEKQRKHIALQAETIKAIYGNLRETINDSLSGYFHKPDLYLNIRVFLPKKGFRTFFLKLFKKELYFEIHNFDGLFIQKVEKLTFQVPPHPQGLVGICYKDQKIWHDFNLKDNHKKPEYRLEKSQIQITEYCQFAIAAPMYKANNSIDAIITFDSKIKVKEPDDKGWEEIIRKGCKTIYYSKSLIDYKNLKYE